MGIARTVQECIFFIHLGHNCPPKKVPKHSDIMVNYSLVKKQQQHKKTNKTNKQTKKTAANLRNTRSCRNKYDDKTHILYINVSALLFFFIGILGTILLTSNRTNCLPNCVPYSMHIVDAEGNVGETCKTMMLQAFFINKLQTRTKVSVLSKDAMVKP